LIVEADIGTDTKRALERRGHNVRERSVVGVAQAIIAEKGKISGAADPRKPARAASE
jgi:gamma-glutamyltranspeptidase